MKMGALYLILFIFNALNAQQIVGIYLSDCDFIQNKLSYIKYGKIKFKIKPHDFYYKPYVSVKTKDSVFTFSKDSIFGYKDDDGKTYRFFEEKVYPLLNPSENILLYKQVTKIGEPKYQQIVVHYYFSKNPSSPIIPLTILNLEIYYQDNKYFIEFLEIYFKSNSDLAEYDYNHKIYKLSRLLELSKKTNTN